MSQYIRAQEEGGTFFFTLVTYQRQAIFTNSEFRIALRESINEVRRSQEFTINAWVLLPDHLHCIWTLPAGDADFSKRWGRIKAGVTRRLKNYSELPEVNNSSRRMRKESNIWQRRFWEHQIRDERDYKAHMDYLHFNPVKHQYVASVNEWPYSSFHRLVDNGIYDRNWGCGFESDLDAGE